jgi:hypothetical protein
VTRPPKGGTTNAFSLFQDVPHCDMNDSSIKSGQWAVGSEESKTAHHLHLLLAHSPAEIFAQELAIIQMRVAVADAVNLFHLLWRAVSAWGAA